MVEYYFVTIVSCFVQQTHLPPDSKGDWFPTMSSLGNMTLSSCNAGCQVGISGNNPYVYNNGTITLQARQSAPLTRSSKSCRCVVSFGIGHMTGLQIQLLLVIHLVKSCLFAGRHKGS